MEQVIYLDIFFSINFLMDLLILIIMAKLLVQSIKMVKIAGAAIIGAVYACIVIVYPIHNNSVQFIITYIVVGMVMILIPFELKGVIQKLKGMGIFYAATFILNGIVNTVSAFTSNRFVIIALTIVVSIIIISILIGNNKVKRDIRVVTIKFKENTIDVSALIDTGNSLTEPISKKPVSVIEAMQMNKLLGGVIANEKIRMIPFNSIGKQGGVIPGIQVDSIKLHEHGKMVEIKDSIIGIYNEKLSSSNEYSMLLNPKILDSKESKYGD